MFFIVPTNDRQKQEKEEEKHELYLENFDRKYVAPLERRRR